MAHFDGDLTILELRNCQVFLNHLKFVIPTSIMPYYFSEGNSFFRLLVWAFNLKKLKYERLFYLEKSVRNKKLRKEKYLKLNKALFVTYYVKLKHPHFILSL